MAQDGKGNQVGFGDWLAVLDHDNSFRGIVRIVKLSETTKGASAIGAYVDLVGHGRVAKCKVDVSRATLVMRADGMVVS
jgi:hypothetical protein